MLSAYHHADSVGLIAEAIASSGARVGLDELKHGAGDEPMRVQPVIAEVTGKVWKVLCPVGSVVAEEESILIIESMKMEIPVASPCAGRLVAITVGEGDDVVEGQQVASIEA